MRIITALVAMAVSLAGNLALAQPAATSVQLPTFSHFSVGTSVSVPDRGAAYLGGVNRAQGDLRQFGAPLLPFGNRSMGSSRAASGMSVSAWIHDFEAMDEALLGQSNYYQNLARPAQPRRPDAWEQSLARSAGPTAGPAVPSVEDIQRQRLEAQETRASEARLFYERATRAEAEGKPSVAKIYYQMVTKRATGQLKDQALARLDAMRTSGNRVVAGER